MNIKEKIKVGARVFTRPKEWHANGNMEFDELLSLALFHKEIALAEINTRFGYWYKELRVIQRTRLVAVVTVFAIIVTGCLPDYNMLFVCIVIALVGAIMTGVLLMNRRAKIITDKLVYCYNWIIHEVIRQEAGQYNLSPSIEKAFISAIAEAEEQERQEAKRLRRITKAFGYSPTTLNN